MNEVMEASKIGILILGPVLFAIAILLKVSVGWSWLLIIATLGVSVVGALLIAWWVNFVVNKYE